jgi:hypothetical protein
MHLAMNALALGLPLIVLGSLGSLATGCDRESTTDAAATDAADSDATDSGATPFQTKCESVRPEGPRLDGFGESLRGESLRFDNGQTAEELCSGAELGACVGEDGSQLSDNLEVTLPSIPAARDVFEDVEIYMLDGDCECCTTDLFGVANVEVTAITEECIGGVVTITENIGFALETFTFAAPRC